MIMIIIIIKKKISRRGKKDDTNLHPNPNPHLSQILPMAPRHDEHMAPRQGHDVQERKDVSGREHEVGLCLCLALAWTLAVTPALRA